MTGATGFLGSWVVAKALAEGFDVIAPRRSDHASLCIPSSLQPLWINKDLEGLSSSDLQGVDAVIHMASAGVSPKKATPRELAHVNVELTLHLASQACEAGVRSFVVAGTCYEYGLSSNHYEFIPVDACLRPVNVYGASKAAAFHMLYSLALRDALPLVYCRIFTAFGEGQSILNFWPSLRAAALTGRDFEMSSGMQIRDFLPVERVAEQLLSACNRVDASNQPKVINIGSGVPKTLKQFAEEQWQSFNAPGKLIFGAKPSRPDDLPRIVADMTGPSNG
ncbi:NAD(P)-dependent oxidoreductase [Cyanobium sp. NIES-981]|uniref:NAD-dependent epimerase/dehydratase family protein n=1 Tax=Cyanobium sp. NIES-981 TaxID=1851505 RepID=UPI0012FC397A|nr:SDR family oxidoreductase [Cyanobium sp. NIES-981]